MKLKIFAKLFFFMAVFLTLAACSPTASEPTPSLPPQPAPTEPPTQQAPTQPPLPTPTPISDNVLKILFVGNSFTSFYNMPDIFANLMEAGGYPTYAGRAVGSGLRFTQHVKSEETLDMIDSQAWDYVILQENDHNLRTDRHLENKMYPAARQLDAVVKANGAQTVFFITWADKYSFSERGYPSLQAMQDYYTNSYNQIAAELNALTAPVGPAWMIVYSQHPELELWDGDANHPSELGAYLSACVFYAFFTQTSPESSGYTHNLPPETVQILQAAAAEAVLGKP